MVRAEGVVYLLFVLSCSAQQTLNPAAQQAGQARDRTGRAQVQSASESAAQGENYERIAKKPARLSRNEAANASRAVPISEQLQPPNGGGALTLAVTCTDLSRRECALFAKPVSVEVLSNGKVFTPEFRPGDLAGTGLDVTLTSLSLDLMMKVRVTYDEGRLKTAWEPVLPSATQAICCEFLSAPNVARALVPIDREVLYLQAKDASGQIKPFQLAGVRERGNWWKFKAPCPSGASPLERQQLCLTAGDIVTIYADVDGQLKQLAQGSWPTAPAEQSASPPVQVPSLPAAFTPALPQASAVICNDPQIAAPLSAGLSSITVTFGCMVKPPAFVLYVDNKRKSDPTDVVWTQVNRFEYTATLKSPLRPYQWVKVVELDPPEVDTDPPAVQVQNPSGAAPLPSEQPWWVTTTGMCASPTIAPGLYPGDTSVIVTFPDSRAGPACHPDISQVKIFVDNDAIDAKWITWSFTAGNPIVYTARFTTPLLAYQRIKAIQFYPPQSSADSVAQIVPGLESAPPAPQPSQPTIAQASICPDPYIPSAPGLTDSIQAVVGCLPGPATQLSIFINGKQVPPNGVTWTQTGSSPITMTAKLTSSLSDGDSVEVRQSGQRDAFSPAQVAVGPPKPPDISYIQKVQEGATSVTGTAKGLDKVLVKVMDGNSPLQTATASVDSTTNAFTANLSSPLQADQDLEIYGIAKSGTQSDTATALEVQPLALDWGRVRGYFTAGVLLSNNNSQFNVTSANPFLGFNIDKQWITPAASFGQYGSKFSQRFRFNTYFDARLTAIPTGTTSSTTTSPSGSPTAIGGSTGAGGSSPSSSSGSAGNPNPAISSLLSNNQAAALQVGAYLPITISSWDFRERFYSLFVAPIAKVGFYTVTDAGTAAFQSAENANRNTSTFFPFYSYGIRLGHRRDYVTADGRVDPDRAPEQLSYLDMSVGKWANYEYISPYNFSMAAAPACTMPATDPATAQCDIRQRLWRYGFEGLLVIPNTPLVIGLSANVALQHPRGGNLFYLTPPDDLRFLFGVRFDAAKLTGALSKLGGQ